MATTPQQIADEVLHGVIYAAILAAGVFVKNPDKRVQAANLSKLAMELLPLVDPIITTLPPPPAA